MRAYSSDFCGRILRDSAEGLESDEIAEKYGVSRSWVDRVKQRYREHGETLARMGSGRKSMSRRYGRSLRGQRVIDSVPHGHWKTSTVVAGLRHNGIIAPAVFDGAIDGGCFRAYVAQILVPALRTGDIVILDNVAFHKVVGIQDIIEAAGARLLYLPPYSPDFNPIEQVYAKLKQLLRSAAKRTVEELWNTIGGLIKLIAPDEALAYFKNCGYTATPNVKTL